MPKLIYADPRRCIYCRACEVACEREHAGLSGMFVTLVDEEMAVPMSCCHCQDNPCATVCPTRAIRRTDRGAVVVQVAACIGCGLCAEACPFGVIQLDRLRGRVQKCDLCTHRLEKDQAPACVLSCPTRALRFEESDEFAGTMRKQAAVRLLTGLGDAGIVSGAPPSARREWDTPGPN